MTAVVNGHESNKHNGFASDMNRDTDANGVGDGPMSAVKTEPPRTPVKDSPPKPSTSITHNGHGHSTNGIVKKIESDSEDDIPLSARKSQLTGSSKKSSSSASAISAFKKEEAPSDDDDTPLAVRAQNLKKSSSSSDRKRKSDVKYREDSSDSDDKPIKKKTKSSSSTSKSSSSAHKDKEHRHKEQKDKKPSTSSGGSPSKTSSKKVKKEEPAVWKWWEEEKRDDGLKWHTLEHNGPLFFPPYEVLPKSVHFKYNGEKLRLTPATEEVATFYAKMIEHEYTTKEEFNTNFFHDWRKVMSSEERELITDLTKCDFRAIAAHFKQLTEERKAMTKEQKDARKAQLAKEQDQYGTAMVDGYAQKIGNFRIEPPGLFRGRGGHPKMGKLKRRVRPEDVLINCTKGKAPPPPEGHKWKEVRCDNTVTWLASWTENVLAQNKYVMLNPSSRIKGEKDWQKFETARALHRKIDKIREKYEAELKSKAMNARQRAVALYFIDKLALRAGNEKDNDDTADTVGCCSLRVEHIKLHEKLDNKEYVVEFDFLGKDSIRYFNQVSVTKRVFKNLQLFKENKKDGDDLFDRLNTSMLNKYLQDTMPGLTAKVFRTYNASITLQRQLEELTDADSSPTDKVLAYNRANRAVAVLCNHQRAVPKTHEKSMENIAQKIHDKKKETKEAKKKLEQARGRDKEKAERALQMKREQLKKLKVQQTDKDENKDIALGTSKLNYLDPRISVAWCKKYDVDINKIYNKTQREKFQWAIDMTDEDYLFGE